MAGVLKDVDSGPALAVLRALQLNGQTEQLNRRNEKATQFQRELDILEEDVHAKSSAQRELIVSELEHLKEIIDCKKEQLLSKCSLELQQKVSAIEAQREALSPEVVRSRELRDRITKIENLTSQTTFLAVVGVAISETRTFLGGTGNLRLPADSRFRPFTVDAAHRALGQLDLGPYPANVIKATAVGAQPQPVSGAPVAGACQVDAWYSASAGPRVHKPLQQQTVNSSGVGQHNQFQGSMNLRQNVVRGSQEPPRQDGAYALDLSREVQVVQVSRAQAFHSSDVVNSRGQAATTVMPTYTAASVSSAGGGAVQYVSSDGFTRMTAAGSPAGTRLSQPARLVSEPMGYVEYGQLQHDGT